VEVEADKPREVVMDGDVQHEGMHIEKHSMALVSIQKDI